MKSPRQSRPKKDENSTGSPQQGEPLYLVIGRFKRPHGLQGEILFDVITDFPERVKKGKTVYVGEDHQPEEIDVVRNSQKGLLVKLAKRDSLDAVEPLKNKWVYVRAEELPALPEGEYYFHQLTGMKVYDEAGNFIGDIKEILETGANDVYLIITPEGIEMLLAAIDEVIKEISIEDGKVVVSLPEWY